MKTITRAAALTVAAAVLAITTHAGAGTTDAAVWCAKRIVQDTNGTCPTPPAGR